MRRFFISAIFASALHQQLFAQCPQATSASTVPFIVDRHSSAILDTPTAEAILRDGLDILRTVDGPGDCSTVLGLQLQKEVSVFTDGDGSVNTSADLDRLFAMPGDVHVVREIHFCNKDGIRGGINGCSDTNKPLVVVRLENPDPKAEGILWMHEYGHNRGLGHRKDRFAVMNRFLLPFHRQVNKCEQGKYLTPPSPTTCADQSDGEHGPFRSATDFVCQRFSEGISYEDASSLAPGSSKQLVALLKEPNYSRCWENAVVLLGILGDPQSMRELKAFLEEPSGNVDHAEYMAKHSVPLALGYLAYKTNNSEALRYLLEGLHPDVWSARVKWQSTDLPTTSERNKHLTTVAILGLALSGNPVAMHALENLQGQFLTHAVDAKIFEPGTERLLLEAVTTNRRVHDRGLRRYYREEKRNR